ncbi:Aste57867_25107 [Aphanomyces stellatus]|uniref:Aste57867_25107 protein n=1 Tax=Aphanomyces stellatus TaxID=120398 RepID=A0A485LS99_9STRA|nr:hypothetical protein As57867_025029 [Aphanomyces stellatus]VFU01738.1 Aste57867_25107 [Aphanomyces stellatus]
MSLASALESTEMADEATPIGPTGAIAAGRKGRGPRLTDAQRLEILSIVESGAAAEIEGKKPKLSTKRLAEQYGVTQAAVLKLIKQRDKFLARFASGREDVRANRRRGGDDSKLEFENELYTWICGLKAAGGTDIVSPSVVQQQALVVAKKYPHMDKFQASWGWYYRFCNRFNVSGADDGTTLLASAAVTAVPRDTPFLNAKLAVRPKDERLVVPPRILSFASPSARDQDVAHAKVMLEAAKGGDLVMLQSSLYDGVPIDRIDEATGCTALVLATQAGHVNVVKFLLEHGAKADSTDQTGSTVLVLAVKMGLYHIVKLCLESCAKLEATDAALKTPLILAAERGDLRSVKLLVKFGACLDATDEDDATALFAAVKHGHADVCDFLVKKGAKRDTRHIVQPKSPWRLNIMWTL